MTTDPKPLSREERAKAEGILAMLEAMEPSVVGTDDERKMLRQLIDFIRRYEATVASLDGSGDPIG